MRSARAIICVVLFAAFFLLFGKTQSFAQTSTPPPAANPFLAPNVDADVPRNQHTYTQAVTIEVLSAVICQITGIDPIDPSLGCLGINPETRKLGLVKPQFDENGNRELGGMLGATTDLIAATYQQPATSGVYSEYLADNFGIVQKAHAQETSYGFNGLRPILKLWEAVRNIAYILLTLAFIFIGVGVMLRVKIDPRTVMTIQNQIPKVIIGIILITLSYAISAVLIDLMWVSTYAGVNVLSNHYPKPGETLAQKANKNIINNPLTFTNQIFETGKNGPFGNGVFHITQDTSNNVGEFLRQIVKDLLGVDDGEKCFGGISAIWTRNKSVVNFSACAAGLLAFLASVTLKLVLLVVLMVTLFKIWFNLLKAYIYTILYVIVSPIMIVFGLLPTKPMGFENWLRRLFVNVAVFPLTAFLLIGARLLMDIYQTDSKLFVPPLVGNPNAVNFGTLLAFGAILITPHIQTILQEKMGVKGIGSPGLVAAGLAGGAAVVGAPVSRAMKHLNRRDNRGNATGMLSVGKEMAGEGFFNLFAKHGSKYAARKVKERELLRSGKPEDFYKSDRQKREEAKQYAKDRGKKGIIEDAEKRSDESRATRWWRRKNGRKIKGKKPDDGSPGPSGAPATPPPHTGPGSPGAGGAAAGAGTGGAASTTHTPDAGSPKGSVATHDGNVTITGPATITGPVTSATGATPHEAKQSFIGKKFDEYVDRAKKKGQTPPSISKQSITVHIEELLEKESKNNPEGVANMHDSEWEHLFKQAEEKEKPKEGKE